jgi:16S rRNA (adenine1518-N6/adenine1519-N6)-dimethyltransferase
VEFKKKLGQHMVVSKNLVRRIVNYAELKKDDVVLEVGCGTGNLTAELLKCCRVVGIEMDPRFIDLLSEKFSSEIDSGKLRLVKGDALKIEFPHFTKFVSNIPYKISSPLTFKLLRHKFDLAVVMYQREFAERLVGERSRLGVVSKAYCRAEILEIVKPFAFKPRPSIESAIVKIIPVPLIDVKNMDVYERFVTFAFSMKRKKMGKIVEEWNRRYEMRLKIDSEVAEKRPEEVGAKKFAEIVDYDIRTG